MSANGSAGIRLRAIERHERNVLGFQMANKTGIGGLHADEEFGPVRFDVFLDLVNQPLWARYTRSMKSSGGLPVLRGWQAVGSPLLPFPCTLAPAGQSGP